MNSYHAVVSIEKQKETATKNQKHHYRKNKESILQRTHQYYEEHREEIKNDRFTCVCGSELRRIDQARHTRCKKHMQFNNNIIPPNTSYNQNYYLLNKEICNERNMKYREINREKLKAKVKCDCGSSFIYNNKAQHYKTIKHQNWLKTQNHTEQQD